MNNDCLINQQNETSDQEINIDIENLIKLRNTYPKNLLIGYLNINSLRNKIGCLQVLLDKASLDILCIDETKLDASFPDHLFQLADYQFPPFRRDRNSLGGGKMVFIRQGLISKRLETFETKIAETICIELTICKKKWCILFAYRPPGGNKDSFFQEISICISKIMTNYENIFIAGDLNADTLNSDSNNVFTDFIENFDLINLITQPTCFKSLKGTLLDVLLTNRPKHFQKTFVCETGLSDHHKLVATFFKSTFSKLPPKDLKYRNFKNFQEGRFLHELDQLLIQENLFRSPKPYSKLTEIYSNLLDQHAPFKIRKVRGNQAPFMNKELSKAIMNKSKNRKKYLKWPSRENCLAYK